MRLFGSNTGLFMDAGLHDVELGRLFESECSLAGYKHGEFRV